MRGRLPALVGGLAVLPRGCSACCRPLAHSCLSSPLLDGVCNQPLSNPASWAAASLELRRWAAAKAKGRKAGPRAAPADKHAVGQAQEVFDIALVDRMMRAAVDHLAQALAGMRTGRASPGMLDPLKVDAYGSKVALKSLATVSVRDAQLLAVTVFDPTTFPQVQKAIQHSPLSLTPEVCGQEILVPVPRVTQDTLRGILKLVKQEAEASRVAVRHARKAGMDDIKKLIASEDGQHRFEKEVQKITDDYIQKIEEYVAVKERELQAQ